MVCVACLYAERVCGCEGDGNAGVGDGGGVVVVSAGYVGGTRGSGIVYSAADVLGMRVARGMRGVGGMCEMCMCLARGRGRGRRMDESIGFWPHQSCGNRGSVGRVSLFGWRLCMWGVGRGLYQGLEGWCYVCVDGRSRYLYIVIGGYLRILGAPSVQSCFTLSRSANYDVFVCSRYCKSSLVCVWLSDLDLSRHHPLL